MTTTSNKDYDEYLTFWLAELCTPDPGDRGKSRDEFENKTLHKRCLKARSLVKSWEDEFPNSPLIDKHKLKGYITILNDALEVLSKDTAMHSDPGSTVSDQSAKGTIMAAKENDIASLQKMQGLYKQITHLEQKVESLQQAISEIVQTVEKSTDNSITVCSTVHAMGNMAIQDK